MHVTTCTSHIRTRLQSIHTVQGKQSPLCQGRDTQHCWNRGAVPWPTRSELAEIVRKALQRSWETLINLILLLLSATTQYSSHACNSKCLTYLNYSCCTNCSGAVYESYLKCKTWTALSRGLSPTFHRRNIPHSVWRNCRGSQIRTCLPTGCDPCSLGYLHVLHLPALGTQARCFFCPVPRVLLAFSFLKSSKCCASKVNRAFLIPALTIS